mgnify:CR=1 FL=1
MAAVPPQPTPEVPPQSWDEHVRNTISKLHQVYTTYVKPLEDRFKYDLFKPSWFEETILNAKPFVTFFGPFSAGKSTFINHLLQSNYLWTGPQPTTAEFTVILHGDEPGPLDGRVLANARDLPFRGLAEFGESFLQNFQGFQAPHDLLKSVTLIDTPGILESAKDIHSRKYDYIKLARWFAERSDLIFVMFDPTKLDAGMELKMMFKVALKGMEGKVRIILNKSDSMNTQELMRVYGSLFWNLSNMITTTEPPRVYVGSFWDQPYAPGTFHLLFSQEKADLIHELTEVIPMQALDKKVASLIKRCKDVFVHAIIIGQMRQELPMLFGKDKAKRKALDELPLTYEKVASKFKMNHRDFPPVEDYRAFLEKFDLETFPTLEKVEKEEGLLTAVRQCIDTILPRMLRPVKPTSIADPRNRDQRRELQDKYHQTIVDQVAGRQGMQGSSDVVQAGQYTTSMAQALLTAGMTPQQAAMGLAAQPSQVAQAPQSLAQPAQRQVVPPPAGLSPEQQIQWMQLQLQMMQAASPPQPPAPVPGVQQFTPQQLQMLLAAQQQQQQQQQQRVVPVQPVEPQPQLSTEQLQRLLALQQQQQQQPQQ